MWFGGSPWRDLHVAEREAIRDWQLVRLTHWTFDEIDAASALRCDWLLAIESLALEFEHPDED